MVSVSYFFFFTVVAVVVLCDLLVRCHSSVGVEVSGGFAVTFSPRTPQRRVRG